MNCVSMYRKILASRITLSFLLLTLILPLINGCATGPKVDETAIFYPPLPNPPRIQFLHRFTNEYDLGGGGGSLGKFLLGSEENISPINKPYGAAIHDGKIYVVDARGGGYAVFDLKENQFSFVVGSGSAALKKPLNMVIDEAGNKYIADSVRKQIVVFDSKDEYLRAYGEEGEFKPTDIALSGDRLFVCDIEHNTIQVLDRATGEIKYNISSPGQGQETLAQPTNIDIMDDKIYVSDTFNGRVQIYTLDGDYISTVGSYGTGMGQMARPKGVAVDKEHRLYVVDAAFQNIQIFDKENNLLLFFGGVEGRDKLLLPSTVVIDYDNVEYFKQYADPKFNIEYVILVVSQYGVNKVNAYGFGKMEGMDYTSISAEE